MVGHSFIGGGMTGTDMTESIGLRICRTEEGGT